MTTKVRRNPSGIKAVLTSPEVARAVHELAGEVARNVEGQGLVAHDGTPLPVQVDDYTTDRAASSVTITHPAGLAMQAKHGVLTRAASAAGLEVKAR